MIKIRCECNLAKRCKACHGTGWRYLNSEPGRWLVAGLCFAIIVAMIALALLQAELAYGDWTCAFAECRKVIKP